MKYMLSVCLAVFTGVTIFAANGRGQVPALQTGVSVQMVPSSHAAPMPEADNPDAWVITVTSDGRIYCFADLPVGTNAQQLDRAADGNSSLDWTRGWIEFRFGAGRLGTEGQQQGF